MTTRRTMTARVRRRIDLVAMASTAATLVVVGGPSLLLDDLTLHQWIGVVFLVALALHVWCQWTGVIIRPGAPRRRRRPRSRMAGVVRGTDGTREALAVTAGITGVLLILELPGETLHVVTGFALLPFAAAHVARHRPQLARYFSPRRDRRRLRPPREPGGGSPGDAAPPGAPTRAGG